MVYCSNCSHNRIEFEYKESTGEVIAPLSAHRSCAMGQSQFDPSPLSEVQCEKFEQSLYASGFAPSQLFPSSQLLVEPEKSYAVDYSQVLSSGSNRLDFGIERSEEAIDFLSQSPILNPIPEPYREEYEEKLAEVRTQFEELRGKHSELADLTKKVVRKVERLEKKREREIRISPKIEKDLPQEVQYILNQVYGCFENNLCDACGPMMRKALCAAIDIRFKRDGKEDKMLDKANRHLKLKKMIEVAKQERYITPSIFKKLNQLKWVTDISAHDYHIRLTRADVEMDLRTLRMTLERLYPAREKTRN